MARRPRFNDEESSIIDLARSSKLGGLTAFAFSYLTLGICVSAFGLYYNSRIVTAAGLLVLIFGRWQEIENDRAWGRIWASVVKKYEAAIDKYEDERE
ncbi:MAG: hypothetical protein Aurels2KO_00370 [Aureliella sp.]